MLAQRSSYWERLLSGPFAESTAETSRLRHALPVGVGLAAARRALAYLYTGSAEDARVGGPLRVDSAEAVGEVCELLQWRRWDGETAGLPVGPAAWGAELPRGGRHGRARSAAARHGPRNSPMSRIFC